MDSDKRACSICGGDLKPGVLLAPTFGAVGNVVSPNSAYWYPSPAQSGPPMNKLPKERHAVTAHRCTNCGHLELFAR